MSSPRPASADRNLLFGILALQMDFLSRDALIQGMNAWVLRKTTPLGQILKEQGALSGERLALLEALVEEHLKQHANDSAQSLAALSSLGSARQDLERIADPDVQASLAQVSTARVEPLDLSADSAKTATALGQRFRIIRPHAKGGLGEVYVAYDEELHREVALKEIHERHAHNPQSRARFLLEAEVTGRLEHPGVVPVYALGQYAGGRPFYAMRFVRGDNLKEAIRRFHQAEAPGRDPGERRLAFRQLLGRFVDVCNAVAYAHSRGVLHRDLKPGNIMLGKYGETLVVDWGLAKAMGQADRAGETGDGTLQPSSGTAATQAGAALGTPAYMPPEQAAGKLEELGPASDVYSLGGVLYCLLTGQAPFGDGDIAEVLVRVQVGEYAPPRAVNASVPRALEAVCRKAMAHSPQERYLSARALAEEIEHWLADEPVLAWSEPWTVKARRWLGRHRTLVAGAAAAVVVAVVSLGAATALLARANEREREARAEEAQQRREAEAARAEETRQRQRAEAARAAEAKRRHQAREALDAMSSGVVQEWLTKSDILVPEQTDFLQQALKSYEEFSQDIGQDEQTRAGVAQAYYRVATIREVLGHRGQAEQAYHKCRDQYAQLIADFPERAEFRRELGKCHIGLGVLLVRTREQGRAERSFRDGLKMLQETPAVGPAPEGFRQDLAKAHNALASILSQTGRRKEAAAEYHNARAVQKQLVAEFPNRRQFARDLAITLENFSGLQGQTQQWQEAESACREALALRQALFTEFPTQAEARFGLAMNYSHLGLILQDTNRSSQAEEVVGKAVGLMKQLANDYPSVPRYSIELANAQVRLSTLCVMKAPDQAQHLLDEAQLYTRNALRAEPDNIDYLATYCSIRGAMTNVYLQLHDHVSAAAAAEVEPYCHDPNDMFEFATAYAGCAAEAYADKRLPEPKRQTLGKSYGDRAMKLLLAAVQSGYADGGRIRTDGRLDALRPRPDFQDLLKKLEKQRGTK
jgi:serine/threonine-protein kinase